MIPHHSSTQLPPTKVALLALPILSTMVTSHVLPRKTFSPPSQQLSNVVLWPELALATDAPAPTSQPLRRRSNTVCGYIGGDPNLPATCLAGSHCAVHVEHGAIGCCPDQGPCKGGVFTGCVDRNSGPQTMADPYIFTCSGRDVCYKNQFAGGYFQYGCGSASGLATTVLASAFGKPALTLTSISVKLTATPTRLSRATTLGFEWTDTLGSSSIRGTTSGADQGFPTRSHEPQPSTTTTGAAAPGSEGSSINSAAAIIGGTVGGVALICTLALLGFLLWRRKAKKNGQSSKDTPEAKNPRSMAPGQPHFEPYTPRQEVTEAKPLADVVSPLNLSSDGVSTESGVLGDALQQPRQRDAAEGGGLTSVEHSRDSDRVPLTTELEEFSRGFNAALERIEPDSDNETQHSETYRGRRRGSGGGVLWQQNRRSSRNLVWM